MEMHQVRYFLAVSETLNFTRAAEQCHVAQPSLTRAIKKLEDELGGPLLHRERNRTHLTELGRRIRPHLERIYGASEAARTEAEGYRKMDKAPLRLGVMCTIGPARLVGFFHSLRRELPSVDLSLHEIPGARLVQSLLAGEVDVAIVGMPDYPERLDVQPLFVERYVIGFPKGHRFEAMSVVPLAALDGVDYLARVNCEYSEHLAALGEHQAIDVSVRYRTEREDWIQAMVIAGMGCSIMPEHLPTLPGIGVRPLVEPAVSREVALATVAGRRFSPILRAFVRTAHAYDWKSRA